MSPNNTNYTSTTQQSATINTAQQDVIDMQLIQQCLLLVEDNMALFLGHDELIRKLIPYWHDHKDLTLILHDVSHVLLAKAFLNSEIITIVPDGKLAIQDNDLINSYQWIIKHAIKSAMILSQQVVFQELNSIGTLRDINYMAFSNSTIPEYYQQLLDAKFKPLTNNKRN